MARFGLKKQGRQWGVFHGSEMIRDATNIPTGSAQGAQATAVMEQEPTYDNDQEYRNVKAALREASRHPPLESSTRQHERERLQGEVEARLAALKLKHHEGDTIAWDDDAEAELHAALRALAALLQLVGLSTPHGPGVIGNPEGLPGGEKREG